MGTINVGGIVIPIKSWSFTHDGRPIRVGFTAGDRADAAARFARILGDDLKAALPGLIDGITDDDKAIREPAKSALAVHRSRTQGPRHDARGVG